MLHCLTENFISLTAQVMRDLSAPEIYRTAKWDAPTARTIKVAQICLEWMNFSTAGWLFASVYELRTSQYWALWFPIPNEFELDPNAFHTPIAISTIVAPIVIGGACIAMGHAKWNPQGKVYRFVHLLKDALPYLAKTMHLVSAVALLYLGAPALGLTGVNFVYQASSLVFDLVHRRNDQSLIWAGIERVLKSRLFSNNV